MASVHKKKKVKNSYQVKMALKHKGPGIKGLAFFTPSQRRVNKKIKIDEE